jgi:uncharacterized protein
MSLDLRIAQLLATSKTIAIVGLSPSPGRPSHGVAAYLQSHGYRVIPVNPNSAGSQILGEHCYATLADAATALAKEEIEIDIVDCFRKAEGISPIARDAVEIGAKCLWMQLGIVNDDAATMATAGGLQVVMDHCLEIEHSRLSRHS